MRWHEAAVYRPPLLKSDARVAQSPHYGEFSAIVVLHTLLQLILGREEFNCCGVLHVEFACKLHFLEIQLQAIEAFISLELQREPAAGSVRWEAIYEEAAEAAVWKKHQKGIPPHFYPW